YSLRVSIFFQELINLSWYLHTIFLYIDFFYLVYPNYSKKIPTDLKVILSFGIYKYLHIVSFLILKNTVVTLLPVQTYHFYTLYFLKSLSLLDFAFEYLPNVQDNPFQLYLLPQPRLYTFLAYILSKYSLH